MRPETTPPRPRNWTWRILFTAGLTESRRVTCVVRPILSR